MDRHNLKLSAPYYLLIKNDIKMIDCRINDPKIQKISAGDIIEFRNHEQEFPFEKRVVGKRYYKSFYEAVLNVGLENVFSYVQNIDDAVRILESFPGFKEGQTRYGVVMIYLHPMTH